MGVRLPPSLSACGCSLPTACTPSQVRAHLWLGVSVQASMGGQPRAQHIRCYLPAGQPLPSPPGPPAAEVTLSCYVPMKLALVPVQDLGEPPASRCSPGILLRLTWLQARLAPSPGSLSILHLPCASRPPLGAAFAQVQGLTTTGGFFPGSITASVT